VKEGSALRCYVWVKQMVISNLGVLSIILLANGILMRVDFFRYNYLLMFFLQVANLKMWEPCQKEGNASVLIASP